MKTKIEPYRGWQIFFDDAKELFYANKTKKLDDGCTKLSFASAKISGVKLMIDQEKDNCVKVQEPVKEAFVPFKVIHNKKQVVLKVVGFNNGVWEIERAGKKEQIIKCAIFKDLLLFTPQDEKRLQKIEETQNQIKKMQQVVYNTRHKMTKTSLYTIAQQYTN